MATNENLYLQEIQDIEDRIFDPEELDAEIPEVGNFDLDNYLIAKEQLPKGDGYQSSFAVI
jgi:hypothetical protein